MNQPSTVTVGLAVLVLAAVLTAGCADQQPGAAVADAPGAAAGAEGSTSGTESPAGPGTSPATSRAANPGSRPRPTPDPSPVIVNYERSGGVTGIPIKVTIRADGRLTRASSAERCDVRLNPAQLKELRADLDQADIASLRSAPRARRIQDGFNHVLGYRGRIVRTYDAVAPARLQAALARLGWLATMPCLR